MCSIVLDTAHVFVCISIVDASVDAFTGVFEGEFVLEIMVSSLVYLLVMTVPCPMLAASVLTTTNATSRPATDVVW